MSAKFLYNLSDENPDLRKHIGCMNGIFHMFDRSHFLGRRIVGHTSKKIPQDQTSNSGGEPGSVSQKTKKKSTKVKRDNQVDSTEPSRASFSSSSCSSSFSTAEPPAINQTTFNENPTRSSPISKSIASSRWTQKSPDLKTVVKHSINKDTKSLSNYPDSPRPSSQHKSATSRASSPLNVSSRAITRTNSTRSEAYLVAAPQDSPRLSYDERELKSGRKSNTKLRERPRFSLDSKERSIKSSGADVKSNNLANGSSLLNEWQETGGHSSSSVITRLMGLEVVPDSVSTNHCQAEQIESPRCTGSEPISRLVERAPISKKNHLSHSPRRHSQEIASSTPRNVSYGMKPVANTKIPMEPAPWKQPEGKKAQELASKPQTDTPNINISVYGEIQKRLTQIEFKKSGKDLRALKQILEAMEKTQEMLESRKDHPSSPTFRAKSNINLDEKSSQHIPVSITTPASLRNSKSTIVVMKPGETFHRTTGSSSPAIPKDGLGLNRIQIVNSRERKEETARKKMDIDLTPRPNHCRAPSDRPLYCMGNNTGPRQLRKTQSLKESDLNIGEITRNTSPRLHQKKKSQTITHSSDLSKKHGQSGRQLVESTSPSRKPRLKFQQKNDNGLSDIISDTKDLSHQTDARSQQSQSNISLASNADYTEVTSQYRFEKISDAPEQHTPKKMSPDSGYTDGRQKVQPVKISLEQLSPVSVLDAAFYGDESPSPVKKKSNAFKEVDTLCCEEVEWIKEETVSLPSFRKPENNQNITDMMELIIDGTAVSCNNNNPDHKYISKILLASGLLRNLELSRIMIQINQSRLPMNPNLFFILEQDSATIEVSKDKHKGEISQRQPTEKARRKLIFDSVNEILGQKFVSDGCSKQWDPSSMLINEQSRGQQILLFLCSEIDQLQALNSECNLNDEDILESILKEDLSRQTQGWRHSQGEISGIVLDIERLIFKDLITEIVCGEVAALQGRH